MVARKADQHNKDTHSIKYAYVTFRNEDDKALALRAFRVNNTNHFCITKCCCCLYEKRIQRINEKSFEDKLLFVSSTCDPDEIKWENLGVSQNSRMCRQFFIGLLAVIIVILSTWAMVAFSVKSQELQKEF